MIKQNTLNRPTEPSEISYADEGKKPPYCNKVTKPIARAAIISRDEKNLQKIKESYNFEQYKKDAYQFFAKEKTFELNED